MLVSEQSLKNLEFDKVLNWLSTYTKSEIAKKIILQAKPLKSIDQIRKKYALIEQFIKLINARGKCFFDGLINISPLLRKAKIEGSFLSSSELLTIASQCILHQNVKKFIQSNKELAPDLYKIASEIKDFIELAKSIKRIISEQGEFYDIASEELLRLRKQKKDIQQTIMSMLESFIKKKENANFLQEQLIFERDGRFVVLVKTEKKKEVNAIIHGTSSSGAAYYCELLHTVELNNQLKILKENEKQICKDILQKYTNKIKEVMQPLLLNQTKVAKLEVIHSLAEFSIEQGGCIPQLKPELGIELEEIYHPLLKYKADKLKRTSIISLNIKMEPIFSGLIITGPNMGGKTVALKNIGLAFLMSHYGIPITGKKASIPFIQALYADIGEKQDLLQNLSTFSSHIKNIIPMIECKEKSALFIIDELGTGTDPSEGAPLAVAILDALLKKEGIVIATTHHNAVKVFAEGNSIVMNASMDFDTETLKPTFKIIPGIPGTSHAFEIAHKLGLGSNIIDAAKKMRVGYEAAYYNALEKINLQIKEFEMVKQNWFKNKEKMENQLQIALRDNLELKKILKEEYLKLNESVKEFLRKSKIKIENLTSEMKKLSVDSAVSLAKETLKQLDKEGDEILKSEIIEQFSDEKIAVNDRVKLKGTSLKCTVSQLNEEEGYAIVNFGNYMMQIPLGMLIKIKEPVEVSISQQSIKDKIFTMKRKDENLLIANSINLIGLRLDEAIEELKRFIDKAVLNNVSQVKIIHGYGKIKAGVIDYLSKNSFVKRWREAEPYEGGGGSTIAEIMGIDE